MARPIKERRICELPRVREFGPQGACADEAIELTLDEYEAIRLIDRLDFSQGECAQQMNVARATVQLIYLSARKKLAEAIVEGRRLQIGGGVYCVCPQNQQCCAKRCKGRDCAAAEVEAASGCASGPCPSCRMGGHCGK